MKARVVVLAASALESVRILLNSGVANGSGKVGKYIMDTVGADFSGQVPLLENLPPHNEDGADGLHLYTPWWLYKEQLAGKLGFARGYHIEFGGGRTMPGMGTASGLEWLNGGNYGKKFKEDARRYYGSFVWLRRPRRDDPERRLLRRARSEGERQVRHPGAALPLEVAAARDSARPRTCRRPPPRSSTRWAAAIRRQPQSGDKAIKQGGIIIHEVGGAIMGDDPAKSVTNSFGQCWDVKNLFITDGATLCSNADKNPTLTIMALAWRASDHMLGLMKRKEL